MKKGKELETSKYVVACLDVLGASALMKSPDENKKFLNNLNKLYHKPVDFVLNENRQHNTVGLANLKIRTFSDNIVIAQRCKQTSYLPELAEVIVRSAFLQAHAMSNGMFLRGAIVHGDFYFGPRIVYGEALVRAHELESEYTKYPRVIVDEDVFKELSSKL